MPAFGKSGTWRIFCLSCSIRHRMWKPLAWSLIGNVSSTTTLSNRALEPLHRVLVPQRRRLYTAVVEVAHPSAQRLADGGRLHEVAEADALHTAAAEKSPRRAHGRRMEAGMITFASAYFLHDKR